MDAGPDIDPLHELQDATELFLLRLSMAHTDIDEVLASFRLPHNPPSGSVIQPSSVWNPRPGPVYRARASLGTMLA